MDTPGDPFSPHGAAADGILARHRVTDPHHHRPTPQPVEVPRIRATWYDSTPQQTLPLPPWALRRSVTHEQPQRVRVPLKAAVGTNLRLGGEVNRLCLRLGGGSVRLVVVVADQVVQVNPSWAVMKLIDPQAGGHWTRRDQTNRSAGRRTRRWCRVARARSPAPRLDTGHSTSSTVVKV